jgi:hypothetical protein
MMKNNEPSPFAELLAEPRAEAAARRAEDERKARARAEAYARAQIETQRDRNRIVRRNAPHAESGELISDRTTNEKRNPK